MHLNPQATICKPLALDGFKLNQYNILHKIGAGTFGLIYLVNDGESQYAAKIVLKSPPRNPNVAENKKYIQQQIYNFFNYHQHVTGATLDLDDIQNNTSSVYREIALHLRVHQYPNVATIKEVLDLDFALVIIMDYFPQGDLFKNIIDEKIFANVPAHQDQQLLMKNCMCQLIDVIGYLAAHNIYHCDLKPENIMVQYDPTYQRPLRLDTIIDYRELCVVLIDFGLAMDSNMICCNACRGSSFYMAPERVVNYTTSPTVRDLVDLSKYPCNVGGSESASMMFPTLAGDIWLLGVLFINITCLRNPWPTANINDTSLVFPTYILHNTGLLRDILPISGQFNRLLDRVFRLDPNERISLYDLFEGIVMVDFFHDHKLVSPPHTPNKGTQLTTPPYSEEEECLTFQPRQLFSPESIY